MNSTAETEAGRRHIATLLNDGIRHELEPTNGIKKECSHPKACHFEHNGGTYCSACGDIIPGEMRLLGGVKAGENRDELTIRPKVIRMKSNAEAIFRPVKRIHFERKDIIWEIDNTANIRIVAGDTNISTNFYVIRNSIIKGDYLEYYESNTEKVKLSETLISKIEDLT